MIKVVVVAEEEEEEVVDGVGMGVTVAGMAATVVVVVLDMAVADMAEIAVEDLMEVEEAVAEAVVEEEVRPNCPYMLNQFHFSCIIKINTFYLLNAFFLQEEVDHFLHVQRRSTLKQIFSPFKSQETYRQMNGYNITSTLLMLARRGHPNQTERTES